MKKLFIFSLLLTACGGQKGETGLQGVVGLPGKNAKQIEAFSFCPTIPGVLGHTNRESYLVVENFIYAIYTDGTHIFLTLLNPGTYQTTDGRNCTFTVTADGQVL